MVLCQRIYVQIKKVLFRQLFVNKKQYLNIELNNVELKLKNKIK